MGSPVPRPAARDPLPLSCRALAPCSLRSGSARRVHAPLHQDGPGRAVRTERPAQAVAQPERFGQRHGEPRGRDGPGQVLDRDADPERAVMGIVGWAEGAGRLVGQAVGVRRDVWAGGPAARAAAGDGAAPPPPAGSRPAGRSAHRRGRAPKAVRAHSRAAVNVAIGDWSVRTSTSSSESRAKARHRATSSQLSKALWSAPVESATTVYCGG